MTMVNDSTFTADSSTEQLNKMLQRIADGTAIFLCLFTGLFFRLVKKGQWLL
jgi:hypothetical protein